MSAAVGDDIESICAKCGDVWHVVVAKVGDKIAKVLCKQCNATHRYKAPGGPVTAAKVAGAKPGRAPAAPKKPSATAIARAAAAAAEAALRVVADVSRPVLPYKPVDFYTSGQRLTHPTFGEGVVETTIGPGKIEVFFASGRKVLAQAKSASTLERPKGGTGGPGVG